jgi:hypothetical protein
MTKRRGFRALLVIFGLAGLVSGPLWVGLKKGGFLTLSDVGHLPELAHVQDALRPLDACAMEYARRDKHGHRAHFESVFVTPCSDRSAVVVVKVEDGWGRRGVGFELARSASDQRWRVLVEKDEVPFADLVGALNAYAPIIAVEYPQKLHQRPAAPTNQTSPELDEARRKAARRSYPE